MLPTLSTDRLRLRPALAADGNTLWRLWTEPEVRRYLLDDVVVSQERAAELLEEWRGLEGDGLGLWVIASSDTDWLVGCAGLFPVTTAAEFEPRLRGEVEPLVAVRPELWRRGFASEALRALLAHAFELLDLRRLVASVDEPNHASHALVQRLGFRRFSRTLGPRFPLVHYVLEQS